ncbi:hypothetical protein Patl1_17163 [Pistacia atlantica]|uniref:Uncharacterized protein n=1 Tax=Pistacia atlantica TaxID=434234 RepID=A0ACC1BAP5_9ROSI|nr:hypothetical protein Patl1_17163 [Pistacia atlantica]
MLCTSETAWGFFSPHFCLGWLYFELPEEPGRDTVLCLQHCFRLKGQSNKRPITMDEVKQNKKEGVDMLMKAVGKDSTSLFSILFWKFTCPHCFIEMTI